MLGPEIDVASLEERIFLLKTQDNAVSWLYSHKFWCVLTIHKGNIICRSLNCHTKRVRWFCFKAEYMRSELLLEFVQ